MEVADLAELLAARRYRETRCAAEELLRRGNLTVLEQAQTYLSLSYSLAALHLNQEALAPAELAVHYSCMTSDHDLLGRSLYHLAELCADLALYKRALTCLEQYFRQMPLYQRARSLEGRAFYLAAVCHRNMWRASKAAEYFRKAYQWHLGQGFPQQQVEPIRAELIWQWLRTGQMERAVPLIAQSQHYAAEAPQDVGARVSLCNNLAYRAYLEGALTAAAARAEEAVRTVGATAAQKACAYLTLHYISRTAGSRPDAFSFGMLARIQAIKARRVDLERELTRSLLNMQDHVSLPRVEALLHSLRSQPDMPGNSQTAVE